VLVVRQETAQDVEALQEQLAAAESRADQAESERDALATELEAAQDQLAELTEETTSAAPSTATPATTAVETTPPTTAAPPTGVPAAPDASPYVEAIGDISTLELPAGEPGAVSVILVESALDQSQSLPVVVRNNTAQPVGAIDVTGTARDGSGGLVGSGSSQGFKPVVVAPGEIAFGYVFFGDGVPADATFEVSVSADPVGDYFMPVTITELSANTDQLVGVVTNDNEGAVSGPIGVDAICLDVATTAILSTPNDFADQDELAAGATGSFSIDMFGDSCPRGLISASGYSS
jgi:hypothetical protein